MVGIDYIKKNHHSCFVSVTVTKVAHVQALCDAYPKLDAWYDLRRNVGYGTTPFHRKTFGGCKGVRAAVGWEGVT